MDESGYMASTLWDIAGIDSLRVVQQLLGEGPSFLAPFQSIEMQLQGEPCSVLRLCHYNFRIRYSGDLLQLVAPLQRSVWVKQYSWLSAFSLQPSVLPKLIQQATTKAPHRIQKLPNNQAVPARLSGISLLIWRHHVQSAPAIEIQTAHQDLSNLLERLDSLQK